MSKFKVGDTVFVTNWGEGTVKEHCPGVVSWAQDCYIVTLRDGSGNKICYESELSYFADIVQPSIIDCECGAKHTVNPTLHSSWCPRFV